MHFSFGPILNASEISVWHIPLSACYILYVIWDSVFIFIAIILDPCGISFAWINVSIEI